MNIFQVYFSRRKARKITKVLENHKFHVGELWEFLVAKGMIAESKNELFSTKTLFIGSIPVFIYSFSQMEDESKWHITQYNGAVIINSVEHAIKEIKSILLL